MNEVAAMDPTDREILDLAILELRQHHAVNGEGRPLDGCGCPTEAAVKGLDVLGGRLVRLVRYEAALRRLVATYEEFDWSEHDPEDPEWLCIQECALDAARVAADALGIELTHPPDPTDDDEEPTT